MRNLLFVLAIISLMGLTGCATNQTSQDTSSPVSSLLPAGHSDSYKQFVKDMVMRQTQQTGRSSKCHASVTNKTPWKQAIATINACVHSDQWTRVEELAKQMAEDHADSPWGAYYLGLVADHKNDLTRAEWMLDLALKKAPDVGALHYEKGRILFEQQRNRAAVAEFTTALQIDGNLYPAHGFLGQIYFRDQEYDLATQHFQRLLQAEPNSALGLAGLAECRIQQGDGHAAEDLYTQAIQSYPQQTEFRMRLAYVYEKLDNDLAKALQTYKQIRTLAKAHRLSDSPDISLNEKIDSLESTLRVAQKGRGLASQEDKK